MSLFIVPIFSMRSYETNEYAVLKDGNFQLHLNRACPGDYLAYPRNSSDIKECIELFPELNFVPLWYKENAYETRKHFWSENEFVVDSLIEYYDCSGLVTDITGYDGAQTVQFNFNITMDPEVPRYYIDEFIDIDVSSVERSIYTTVLNQCQKDVLVSRGASSDKIFVDQKVINPAVIERYSEGLAPIKIDGIFHPFRISDKCYQFERVVDQAAAEGSRLYITDPNDSFKREDYRPDVEIIKFKPSKVEYYQILKSRPHIIYHENPGLVFHPGLAEFIYFGAHIHSEHEMPSYEDVVL